jgi:hypothetical protein
MTRNHIVIIIILLIFAAIVAWLYHPLDTVEMGDTETRGRYKPARNVKRVDYPLSVGDSK